MQADRLFWGCKGLFLKRGFFLLLACFFCRSGERGAAMTRRSPSLQWDLGGPMSDGFRQVEGPFSTSTDSFFHSQRWKIAQSAPVRGWLL